MEKSVILKGQKSTFKKNSPAAKFKNNNIEFEMFDLWGCSSSFSSTLELGSRLTFEGAKISILFLFNSIKRDIKGF